MAREQVKRKQSAAPVEIGRGVLIKNGARVGGDPWIVLDDEAPAPSNCELVTSLARFKREGEKLAGRGERLGLLLATGDAVEDIGAQANAFALIVVYFPSFRDGRGFTTARLLRERYGYKGELRAAGDVLEDQIFFMLRCGFDAFEIIAADPEAAYARAARTFTNVYQTAADTRAPAFRLRPNQTFRPLPGRKTAHTFPGSGLVVDAAPARGPTPKQRARTYDALVQGRSARELLAYAAHDLWPGKFAVLSSFGAESAVVLHLLASVDSSIPVIFLETERHFAQTLQYRDALIKRLGLRDVRIQKPDAGEAAAEDAMGDLWRREGDACCALRKVRPLARVLTGFDAWGTGRKRFHGGLRSQLSLIEHDGRHFKVNPLAQWSPQDVAVYALRHDLPAHPLVAQGFPSVGCWPCTKPAETARQGRWAETDQSECGIHVPTYDAGL